ncbi:Golgi apyrase, partial [Rhizoclosmatium hyalinum]
YRDRVVITVLLIVLVALMGTLAVSFSVSGSGTQERPSVHQHLPVNSSIEPVDLAMLALDTGFPVYKPTTVSKEWPTDWYADRRYGIVIDAGSSGSRALIYSWKVFDHPSQKRDLLPLIEKAFPESELNPVGEGKKGRKWSKAIEPGLSSLFNAKKEADSVKLDQVSDYLAPLLKFSESVVPASLHSSTPVYLLATAGMRLVPTLQRAQILQHACETVRTLTQFSLDGGCARQFRVISGEAEGVFGWVAVNYLNKGFGDRTLQVPPPPHKESPNTFGFLDMGGASTQIAFEPVE